MNDFDVGGDTGTAETIADGNTLQILGGTGVATVVSPTDTITISTVDSEIDHGALAGLTDDDHTQYLKLLGRAGGQTASGGTASGDDLIFRSTTNATKGDIQLDNPSTLLWPSHGGTISATTTLIDFSPTVTLSTNNVTWGQMGGTWAVADTIDPVIYMLEAEPVFNFTGRTGSIAGDVYTISPFYASVSHRSADGWILYPDTFHDSGEIVYSGTADKTTVAENPWIPISFLQNFVYATSDSGDYSFGEVHGFRSRTTWATGSDVGDATSTLHADRFGAFVASGPEVASGMTGKVDIDIWGGLIVDWAITTPNVCRDADCNVDFAAAVIVGDLDDDNNGVIGQKWSLYSSDLSVNLYQAANTSLGGTGSVPTHYLEVGGAQGAITAGGSNVTHGAASFAFSGAAAYAWLKDDVTITVGSASSDLGTVSSYWNNSTITTNSTTAPSGELPTTLTFYDNSSVSTTVANDPPNTTSFASLVSWGASIDRTIVDSLFRGVHITPAISAFGIGVDLITSSVMGIQFSPRLVSSGADGGDASSVTIPFMVGVWIQDSDATGAGTEAVDEYFGHYIERLDATHVANTAGIYNEDTYVAAPPTVVTVGDAFTINPANKSYVEVTGTAARISSLTTAITDGMYGGQLLWIVNTGANNVTIDDGGNTSLGDGGDCLLGPSEGMHLIFSATDSLWIGISCAGT